MSAHVRLRAVPPLIAIALAACGDRPPTDPIPEQPDTPTPRIISIEPSSLSVGRPGQQLSVSGDNFRSTSRVRMNGTELDAEPANNTFLVDVPEQMLQSPGVVMITVFTPHHAPFDGGATSAAAVLNVGYERPFIWNQPYLVRITTRDTVVALAGQGFTRQTEVLHDGVPAAFEYVSYNELRLPFPAGTLAQQRSFTLGVRNPGTNTHQVPARVYSPATVVTEGGDRLGNGCLLDAADALVCWDHVPQSLSPHLRFAALVPGHSFASQNSCALTAQGELYCWGANIQGQLGTGTVGDRTAVPQPDVPVTGGHRFTRAATGWGHSCAIDVDARLWCWGSNRYGQLGSDAPMQVCRSALPEAPCSGVPVNVAGEMRFRDVAVGGSHTCGVAEDGRAWCWGYASAGALGTGPGTQATAFPQPVATTESFVRIFADVTATCALTVDGRAFCWGDNDRGRLGVGDRVSRNVPTAVVGGLRFTALAIGGQHSCGVAVDGAAWCWGGGFWGQLGVGLEPIESVVPLRVRGDHRWTEIRGGHDSTCGLAEPGGFYCWGVPEGRLIQMAETRVLCRARSIFCHPEPRRVYGVVRP